MNLQADIDANNVQNQLSLKCNQLSTAIHFAHYIHHRYSHRVNPS